MYTDIYVSVYMFEIFCTLFIAWVYLLAEDLLVARVEYSLPSVLFSGR